jgi:hypothetical protein
MSSSLRSHASLPRMSSSFSGNVFLSEVFVRHKRTKTQSKDPYLLKPASQPKGLFSAPLTRKSLIRIP